MGAWAVCIFKGGLARKMWVLFLKAVDATMHTILVFI